MVRTCADILCGMLLVSDKLWHLRHLLHSHDLPPTVPSVNAIDVIQGSKYQVLYYRRIESREELMVLWWMERCVEMMQYNLLREVVVLHAIASSLCRKFRVYHFLRETSSEFIVFYTNVCPLNIFNGKVVYFPPLNLLPIAFWADYFTQKPDLVTYWVCVFVWNKEESSWLKAYILQRGKTNRQENTLLHNKRMVKGKTYYSIEYHRSYWQQAHHLNKQTKANHFEAKKSFSFFPTGWYIMIQTR